MYSELVINLAVTSASLVKCYGRCCLSANNRVYILQHLERWPWTNLLLSWMLIISVLIHYFVIVVQVKKQQMKIKRPYELISLIDASQDSSGCYEANHNMQVCWCRDAEWIRLQLSKARRFSEKMRATTRLMAWSGCVAIAKWFDSSRPAVCISCKSSVCRIS